MRWQGVGDIVQAWKGTQLSRRNRMIPCLAYIVAENAVQSVELDSPLALDLTQYFNPILSAPSFLF